MKKMLFPISLMATVLFVDFWHPKTLLGAPATTEIKEVAERLREDFPLYRDALRLSTDFHAQTILTAGESAAAAKILSAHLLLIHNPRELDKKRTDWMAQQKKTSSPALKQYFRLLEIAATEALKIQELPLINEAKVSGTEAQFKDAFVTFYHEKHGSKDGWPLQFLIHSTKSSAQNIRFQYLREALAKLAEETKACPAAKSTLDDLSSQIADLEMFQKHGGHPHLPEGKGAEYDIHAPQNSKRRPRTSRQ